MTGYELFWLAQVMAGNKMVRKNNESILALLRDGLLVEDDTHVTGFGLTKEGHAAINSFLSENPTLPRDSREIDMSSPIDLAMDSTSQK